MICRNEANLLSLTAIAGSNLSLPSSARCLYRCELAAPLLWGCWATITRHLQMMDGGKFTMEPRSLEGILL